MKPVFTTLLLRLPVALPEPMDVNNENPVAPLQLGVGGEIGIFKLDGGALTLGGSTDVWYRSFDTAFPVRSAQIEQHVNFGWRFDTCTMTGRTEGACFWWNVRSGPRLWYLGITTWEDIVVVGMGGDTGMGITFGDGDWRTNLGASVGFSTGFGEWSGSVSLPDGAVAWTWVAGGVRGTLSAGVEF